MSSLPAQNWWHPSSWIYLQIITGDHDYQWVTAIYGNTPGLRSTHRQGVGVTCPESGSEPCRGSDLRLRRRHGSQSPRLRLMKLKVYDQITMLKQNQSFAFWKAEAKAFTKHEADRWSPGSSQLGLFKINSAQHMYCWQHSASCFGWYQVFPKSPAPHIPP